MQAKRMNMARFQKRMIQSKLALRIKARIMSTLLAIKMKQ